MTKQPLTLYLAAPHGFCAGVDRAIKIVEMAIEKWGAPVYVRHEIVHNKYVVDNLRAQGAIFVEELEDCPVDRPVIFSAHGVPKSVPAAAEARAYLEKRGLTPDVLDRWEIGFAPPGWEGLREALAAKGVPEERMLAAGLLKPSDKGRKPYDTFRNRIMFPIRSVQGEVIGFGGRVIDAGEPKYLNSRDTPLFDKGRNLYALDRARAGIRVRRSVAQPSRRHPRPASDRGRDRSRAGELRSDRHPRRGDRLALARERGASARALRARRRRLVVRTLGRALNRGRAADGSRSTPRAA